MLVAISALANTSLTVIYNSDEIIPVDAIAALEGIQSLAWFVGLALIFLMLVILANERYTRAEEAYKGYTGGKKHPLRLWAFGLFFSVFGVGVTLGTWFVLVLLRPSNRYKIFRNISYATGGTFVLSGVFAIAMAAVVFGRMRRAGCTDKVC